MTNFQQYQQQFAGRLKARVLTQPAQEPDMSQKLTALIDSLPYYGDPNWLSCHRGALCNLLQVSLPNIPIATKSTEGSYFGGGTEFKYNGPHSGYRDAFFPGAQRSAAADKVDKVLQGVNPALSPVWWGNYSVTLLTDLIRKTISIPIDPSKLAGGLAMYQAGLTQALTASCLAVFQIGFTPTATALNAIGTKGPAAAALLSSDIKAGEFNVVVNLAIANGGDAAVAAAWFLFNLWITLNALGAPNIDGTIREAQAAGLTVPAEVQPGHWFNGGYTGWFTPLSGTDFASAASVVTAGMPVKATIVYGFGSTMDKNQNEPNGYAQSLCIWGRLSLYKS